RHGMLRLNSKPAHPLVGIGPKTGCITMSPMTTTTSASPTDRLTFPELPRFLAALGRREASVHTVAAYRRDLAAFAAWFIERLDQDCTVTAVTPTDIRDFRTWLRERRNQKPATINRKLAALRSFFQWAITAGLRPDSPLATVKDIRAEARAPRWFAKRELDRLLREVEATSKPRSRARDLAIVLTLRHTGLRVSELVGLRVQDLTLTPRKGSLRVLGKGSKERMIPLNQTVRAALVAYLQVRPAGPDGAERAALFLGQRGPLERGAAGKLVAKYAQRAHLEDFSPHSLRHSFAKQLLDGGEDLVTVKTLLGHERLDTTARYTHPGARDLEEAVGRLEEEP